MNESRRNFLKQAGLGAAGLAGLTALSASGLAGVGHAEPQTDHGLHQVGGVTGAPAAYTDFDPHRFLSEFDYGAVSRTAAGRTVREYHIVSEDKEIEIAGGVKFPAWTYNGQVPGPTIRCTEGDLIRVHFENKGSHPHSIHFHGFHPPAMDGMAAVSPGGKFVYEFDADPFGLHLYHCHVMPLKRHIHKGLYGAFIIDPPGGRPPAIEMVMVMNGFDLDQDGANEFYAVNSVAFAYEAQPIPVKVGEPIRIYLVNVTEFDLLNSFHLHAGMFKYYPTGTRLDQYDYTDTVKQCQGERGILELSFKYPGKYMFHAHQSEFAELGWLGLFDAQ
ncbi:MAG TPA: multicopper oxidase domain-containing protein [Symbiobacteriaceae bacterium]|nr:multicopper oxidase domain-containing protein [Symbiobacteriaceae bacterium]